jgi:alpha-glucosidase (family GH31 glycosyl hydrolase)
MDTIGSVRVSCLSPILVRVEAKTSAGTFENRATMMVAQRDWPDVQRTRSASGTTVTIATANYQVQIPNNGSAITGVTVIAGGQTVFTYSTLPSGTRIFPAPDELGNGYVIADNPRVVQPAWGSTPMPAGALPSSDPLYATQGWDYRYPATPDVYVFVNKKADYFADYVAVRKDFLRLTGPIPIVPLYYLGFANGRYQAVTAAYVTQHADMYRSPGIPIDIYVVDTDWRGNAYDWNTGYFPNPQQFLADMHARHFHVALNDHPQGSGTDFQTRWNGLTGRMNDGLDFWWYDMNWGGIISSPVQGIDQAMWGMKMFWDMQKKFLKDKTGRDMRPGLYTMRSGATNYNTDPIAATHPGSHRYPGWWTGDVGSGFDYNYRPAIDCSVHDGVCLLPHVQHDIAGFLGCDPGDEVYTRWMQFGSLSPQPRVHGNSCGEGSLKRYPWEFSADTKNIVTRYLAMRYRLMPMIYAALRKCHEDGSPLLQRCDLFWPSAMYPQAKSNAQYLFGDDILVKPVKEQGSTMSAATTSSTWLPPGIWYDAWTGEAKTGSTTASPGATAGVSSNIWKIPMFIRQGAIITLCPDMHYTSEKPWDPVTCEVYPPAPGAQSTRTLYEDDKESYDYEKGAFIKTALSVERIDAGIGMRIGAAQGAAFAGMPSARAWIIRLHLDAPYANQQIKVNNGAVSPGSSWTKGNQPQARVINQAAAPNPITSTNFPIPFQGEGQAPGPQAPGPVIEVWLPAAPTSASQVVTLGAITVPVKNGTIHPDISTDFSVAQNRNHAIFVRFAVSGTGRDPRQVHVALCNLKGETIRVVVNGAYASGRYRMSVAGPSEIAAGTYLCRMSIDGALKPAKMVTIAR